MAGTALRQARDVNILLETLFCSKIEILSSHEPSGAGGASRSYLEPIILSVWVGGGSTGLGIIPKKYNFFLLLPL